MTDQPQRTASELWQMLLHADEKDQVNRAKRIATELQILAKKGEYPEGEDRTKVVDFIDEVLDRTEPFRG